MPDTFYVKQNDTLPSIRETLALGEVVIVLTGCSVRFHLRNNADNSLQVNKAASIIDAANGVVQYDWDPTDTTVIGEFSREWEITYPSGDILTVPNDQIGYLVKIADDIA